jgi:hypothetical protein
MEFACVLHSEGRGGFAEGRSGNRCVRSVQLTSVRGKWNLSAEHQLPSTIELCRENPASANDFGENGDARWSSSPASGKPRSRGISTGWTGRDGLSHQSSGGRRRRHRAQRRRVRRRAAARWRRRRGGKDRRTVAVGRSAAAAAIRTTAQQLRGDQGQDGRKNAFAKHGRHLRWCKLSVESGQRAESAETGRLRIRSITTETPPMAFLVSSTEPYVGDFS